MWMCVLLGDSLYMEMSVYLMVCVCKWEAGLQYKGITLWMIISSCLIRCINFALETWALGESDILIKDHEERKR